MTGRAAAVRIDGETIVAPRVRFDLRRTADPTQDRGWVELHNPPPSQRDTIHRRGARVDVDAGQPPHTGTLFTGRAQRIQRPRRAGDGGPYAAFRLTVGDAAHGPGALGGRTNRAWAGPTSVRRAAADIIADLGLTAGPLTAVPETATVTDWTWTGPSAAALTELLGYAGCAWWDDGGTVRARRRGRPAQADAPAVVAAEDGRLVGVPTPTDEGLAATLLLDPLAAPGAVLTIPNGDHRGDWAIVEARHTGDTRRGRFVTRVELRAA